MKNTESKTLRHYQSYLQDESKLDRQINKEDVSIRASIGLMLLYLFITLVTKKINSRPDDPFVSSVDIIFALIFITLIVRSAIRLHALYVLKAVAGMRNDG